MNMRMPMDPHGRMYGQSQGRPSPYPSPAMYMAQKRHQSPIYNNMGQMGPGGPAGSPYRSNPYGPSASQGGYPMGHPHNMGGGPGPGFSGIPPNMRNGMGMGPNGSGMQPMSSMSGGPYPPMSSHSQMSSSSGSLPPYSSSPMTSMAGGGGGPGSPYPGGGISGPGGPNHPSSSMYPTANQHRPLPSGSNPGSMNNKTELPSISPRGGGPNTVGNGPPSSGGISSFQHSPVPGNPTPPLTPNGPNGNCMTSAPFASPQSDHGSTSSEMSGMKPAYSHSLNTNANTAKEEMRLTFPVQDGVLLTPFRLEHNLAVSNHVFHLKPQVIENVCLCVYVYVELCNNKII